VHVSTSDIAKLPEAVVASKQEDKSSSPFFSGTLEGTTDASFCRVDRQNSKNGRISADRTFGAGTPTTLEQRVIGEQDCYKLRGVWRPAPENS
jgi:hypothetical protein